MYNRRFILTGLFSSVSSVALANAPTVSLIPEKRPRFVRKAIPRIEQHVRNSGVSGLMSIELRDARTGKVIDHYDAEKMLPPASVTKSVTALYALNKLGSSFTFQTSVYVQGSLNSGVLSGDVYLVGRGDPTLDTDDLLTLANGLKSHGVKQVKGRFFVVSQNLPNLKEIDPDQPAHVGYNPSISGLNLNFNRVYFGWKRSGQGYETLLEARAKRVSPRITTSKMSIVERSLPVYDYKSKAGIDHWTVARSALGKGGSRWIPVRNPALYSGNAFRMVCKQIGLSLPPTKVANKSTGRHVVSVSSRDVGSLTRSMLKFSTNLTAEVLGLQATKKTGASTKSLSQSAKAMSSWVSQKYKLRAPRFVDHSGLGTKSRISAQDMNAILVAEGWNGALRPQLKTIALRDRNNKIIRRNDTGIVAKTGTLNFVSALSGYIETNSGRKLAFTIFSADLNKRKAVKKGDRENPKGARTWQSKARKLQQSLLRDWVEL